MINRENLRQKLRDNRVPESCHGGIEYYLMERIRPGRFLQAVFENDLVGAFSQADHQNIQLMQTFASFLYNELPERTYSNSPWGSAEQVKAWLAEGQEAPVW